MLVGFWSCGFLRFGCLPSGLHLPLRGSLLLLLLGGFLRPPWGFLRSAPVLLALAQQDVERRVDLDHAAVVAAAVRVVQQR